MGEARADSKPTTPEGSPLIAERGDLFSRVHEWNNLLAAWDRVEGNEGGAGVDGVSLDAFELRLEENLRLLQRDLRQRLYLTQPLLRLWMPKRSGGVRPLAVPTVRDRVAQTAAALVITPLLDREFETASYGFRKGRSVAQAVEQVRRYYEQGFRWVVDADIDSFFDEVDHHLLLARFAESIRDADLARLIASWLAAPIQEGAERIVPTRGLPQGSPISPLLANLYLDRFDEALLKRHLRLVRFADDFLILCRSRPQAESAFELTESLLQDLHLSLESEKSRLIHFDQGFRYLGHLFVRSMILPSPNRQQRSDAPDLAVAGPGRRAGSPALQSVRSLRRPVADTPMAKALAQALEAAHMESLLPSSSPSPPPPVQADSGRTAAISLPHRTDEPSLPQGLSSPPAAPAPSESSGEGDDGPPRGSPPRLLEPFRHTLYIQEQGSVLARQDERLVVKKEEKVLLEVPAAKVDEIFVFGRCSITTPAMTFCLQEEIPIVLLSSRGQYYGLIDSPLADRVTLHRQQFARAADPAFCLTTAKALVRAKLANSGALLERQGRRKGLEAVRSAAHELEALRGRLANAATLEELNGYEGAAAATYFEAFARLLQQDLGFHRRVRHPPTDPVNSLLSFGYALCFYNLYALIRARGLHPYVGCLHALRDRHPALASDLLEVFRAPVVDSLVLYLVNSRVLTASDFYRSQVDPPDACLLRDAARKSFLKHFEQKMASTFRHPRLGETLDWRRALDAEVVHIVQWIRGEVNDYRPLEIDGCST
ncbi:MAG TPA: CRISPR-associated endonuclease Cas1 [Terriglobia bacterium]|nr:CRISPR-associated endonuclease Cas1 [Terriglobia bacterium]